MPPRKRTGSTSNAAPAQTKKSKPNDLPDVEYAGNLHESKRWSKVSGSRNVDAEYRWIKKKDGVDKGYEYICICAVPWDRSEDDDDDEEESDEEDDDEEDDAEGNGTTKKPKKSACDGGETCICQKPAAEHPDHKFILTRAGFYNFLTQRTMTQLRCPDLFGMYIYNDYFGYGILEVLENLVLDYLEADGDWREQWVVCQTIVWFLMDSCSNPMHMVEDGDRLDATIQLVGRIFLSMLAQLESRNLLRDTSEVKDLGFVMGLYMEMAAFYRKHYEYLEGDSDVECFDDYVLAYANKHAVPLVGVTDIAKVAAECDGTVKLPAATAKKPDPWGAAAAIKKHEKAYGYQGGESRKSIKLGGDHFDIMAMSSVERKEHSFAKKDPLGKDGVEALKKGLVPMRG